MLLCKAYRYSFYCIYSWALSSHGRHDLPHLTALFILTLAMFANLVTLALVLGVAGLPILVNRELAAAVGTPLLILLAVVNHRYLIAGDGIERLVDEFEGQHPTAEPRVRWYVVGYLIGSVGLFLGLAILVANTRA